MKNLSFLRTALLATFTLNTLSAFAADPLPMYKLLSERRDSIQLPTYSVEQKKLVLDQVRMVMAQLYVHRDLKLKDFGPASDPLPLLDNLEKKIATISDYDFHKTMSEIFYKQRDWHTTYSFPKPYACYSSFMPISFKEVKDLNGNKIIAVSEIVQKEAVMALMPDDFSVEVGDVVLTYDGQPIREAMTNIASQVAGANIAAQVRNEAFSLTYVSQNSNVLPLKNETTLVLKNRQGKTYTTTIPWVSKVNQKCLDNQQADSDFTGANQNQNEFNRLFRKKKQDKSLTDTDGLKDTAEPILKYKTLSNEYGNFGYFKLESFVPEKLDIPGVVDEFRKILQKDFAHTDGIIIDLRDNGGGIINLADSLVQLFTAQNTTPINFHQKVSPANIFYMDSTVPNNYFSKALHVAAQNGATNTIDLPLNSASSVNRIGQYFFKPVALFMNANCYSSCDMFSAQMQDHGAGIIFGEDPNTGAGGANNYNTASMFTDLPKDNKGPFKELPSGQNIGFAVRQTVRVGIHAGELIEDIGVQADAIAQASITDFYNNDEAQLKIISQRLSAESSKYNSWVNLKGPARQDVGLHQIPSLNLSWGETSAIEYKSNGQSLGKFAIDFNNPNGTLLNVPSSIDTSSYLTGSFEMVGLKDAEGTQRAWRKVVNYRVVAENFALAANQNFSLDLTQQPSFMAIYNDQVKKESGWVLNNGVLRIGNTEKYEDNVHTEASLFLSLPANALTLNFNASISTEENYDFFSVIAVSEGKEITLIPNTSGEHAMDSHSFDLSSLAGKKVEIRFIFDSDTGGTAAGVTVKDINFSR